MSYLATRPDSQVYFQPAIDYFSGNGATSQFTLSRPVASVAQIIVSVANVIQNPNTFSVNNNILTLGGNAPVGTNNVWVQYQTAVIQVNQPGQGTVGASQLQAGAALANIGAGGVTPSYLSTGSPSWDANANLMFNSGYGSVATAYACRAWVNFNGTGTVAIRASGNVSSITDLGTGDYTVNFTNAMPDANYTLSGAGQYDTSNANNDAPMVNIKRVSGALSTTGARIVSNTTSGNGWDVLVVAVSFFR